MASITPVISTSSPPPLQVTTSVIGLDYAAILEMLGPVCFKADEIYYKPTTIGQLSNPIQFMDYDINGNQRKEIITTVISPQQYNASYLINRKGKKEVYDGNQALNFNLDAAETIQLFFYGEVKQNRDALDAFNIDNFKALESAMGHPSFFEDYTKEI